MKHSISKYEETIENLSCYAPEGCGNIAWPLGIPPPYKPPTRFDVLRWDYFNETHIYLKTDDSVIDTMKRMFLFFLKRILYLIIHLLFFSFYEDDDVEDIHEVIDHAMEQLQNKYGIKYE